MTRIISALLIAFSTTTFAPSAIAADEAPAAAKDATAVANTAAVESWAAELAPDAPERHTVVKGDTLWDISAKFVKNPKRWPSLWRLNDDQVKNPHRIYPGQLLVLRRGAEPYLEAVRIQPQQFDSAVAQEIPAIPQNVIGPYLAQPLVVDAGSLDSAPRIVALQEERIMVGPGSRIYVTGIKGQHADTYQLYRPGKALTDPANKQVLGHEADYLGTATVTQAGEPAILRINNAIHEIGIGDRLTPLPKVDVVSYVPHAPKAKIEGRVMSVLDHLLGGPYSIVTLTRGKRDGLEIGHVLALQQTGIDVIDKFKDKKQTYRLPDERYGLVFVFRVFDRVSYALVMQAAKEITAGDTVRTP